MRKFFFLFLLLIGVGVCVSAAPKKVPAKKPLPVWKPSPVLVKQLAETSELPFGTIRLPRGYELFDFPVPYHLPVSTTLSWAKKSSNGELGHLLLITQIPLEETGWHKLSLEESLRGYMEGFKNGFENTQRTPATQGLINGKRALRTDWNGTHRKSGLRLQGSIYIMKDATDSYLIQTMHKNNNLSEQRLATSAALTFKIQSQN